MADTDKMTFAQLGRKEAINQLFAGSKYSPLSGPLQCSCSEGQKTILASKVLLEGTDFNLMYFPLKHLGYKSVIALTGELTASLALAQVLSVNVGVSSKLDYQQISELWGGVLIAAQEMGYSQVSLDLVPSLNGLSLSLSAMGLMENREKVEAHTKDLICVSGSLGAAYLGQQVLEHKSDELEKYRMLVAAYLKPELQADLPKLFKDAKITPSFGFFVSKGLSDAVLRLSSQSGLGVKIYADKIPFEGNSFAVGKELNIDPISAAMNGGDDFRLLFTIPLAQYERFRTDFQVFDIIGHMALPEVGAVLVTPDGLEHAITAL